MRYEYSLHYSSDFPLHLLEAAERPMPDGQFDALKASIAQDGLRNPLVATYANGRYLVHPGKNRLWALRETGRQCAPVLVIAPPAAQLAPPLAAITPQAAALLFSGDQQADYTSDPRYFYVFVNRPAVFVNRTAVFVNRTAA